MLKQNLLLCSLLFMFIKVLMIKRVKYAACEILCVQYVTLIILTKHASLSPANIEASYISLNKA